jgi:ATP-binding protein involved in chromosome partitioning
MPHDKPKNAPVMEILKKVKYPGYSRDIASFGMVKSISVEKGTLDVTLAMQNADNSAVESVREEALRLLKAESGFKNVHLEIETTAQSSEARQAPEEMAAAPKPLKGVARLIAVSSAKGGVGKSTIAVNLACVAAQSGYKVGLMDADIYGPSLPTMLSIHEKPEMSEQGLIPLEKYGVKVMSIGFLIEEDQPLIWRGPIVHKALEQLVGDTQWGNLDVLILDLPPGTGDVQLTLAQKFKLDGAVVVTTPQDIALADVRRGALMFQKVNVPILGIVENMSYYTCINCGHQSHPFGEGGGRREAESLSLPLLGRLPLDPRIMEHSDAGVPIVVAQPTTEAAKSFLAVWNEIHKHLKEVDS